MSINSASKAFIFSLATGGALGQPAFADQQACSCRHLQSVQEELKNAEYQATFFTDMAAKLKAVEDPLIEAHKIPTHPDSDVSIVDRSMRARTGIMRELVLPHDPAFGYKGPATVGMKPGSCEQKSAELDALRDGSQCKEIADIVLAHEAGHRTRCASDTATVYWSRLPSYLAAEEAQSYWTQAKAMRALLKRIIDEGTVTVEAEMGPRITGPQFDVTYAYVTPSFKMEGKSSPGSDTWTLKGKGKRSGKIQNMKVGGMRCTASGQINDEIDMALEMDGLSMAMKSQTKGKPGDIKVRCGGGHGMSMRPQGEVGGGEIFANEHLTNDAEVSRDVSTMAFAKYVTQGGMSVSGKSTVTVKLVCPGQ